MIFTDADLRRLKEGKSARPELDWDEMKALFARLEAAETCVNLLIRTGGQYSEEVNVWRKAAGK